MVVKAEKYCCICKHVAQRLLQGLKLRSPARDVMVTAEGLAARRQQAAVAHHGLIAGLIGEHPAVGETCRLAKRWAASQLLSFHCPDELVELIVAASVSRYVYPWPPCTLRCACQVRQFWCSNGNMYDAQLVKLRTGSIRQLSVPLMHARHIQDSLRRCRKLHPQPLPASSLAGFLRFLQLLTQHDWQVDALLVDPHGALKSARRRSGTRSR